MQNLLTEFPLGFADWLEISGKANVENPIEEYAQYVSDVNHKQLREERRAYRDAVDAFLAANALNIMDLKTIVKKKLEPYNDKFKNNFPQVYQVRATEEEVQASLRRQEAREVRNS